MSQKGFDNAIAYAHELVGVCGHCWQRKCGGRSGRSVLPGKIVLTVEQLLEIIRRAAEEEAPR